MHKHKHKHITQHDIEMFTQKLAKTIGPTSQQQCVVCNFIANFANETHLLHTKPKNT